MLAPYILHNMNYDYEYNCHRYMPQNSISIDKTIDFGVLGQIQGIQKAKSNDLRGNGLSPVVLVQI